MGNSIDCIYLMGGIGERAKLGFPKQFQMLGGKPIFIHGLELLNDIPEIEKIIIVTCDISKTQDIINKYGISKNKFYVGNGNTRQESVYNSLLYVKTEYVLISEGVRPFISMNLYKKIIDDKAENITPIRKSIASVVDCFGNSYNRNDFGEVQMPQKFKVDTLFLAHELAKGLNLNDSTDDVDLLYRMNDRNEYEIKVIEGEEQNIKITSPLDLIIAEAIYEKFNNHGDE